MTTSLPSVSLAESLIQALRQPGQERLLDLVRNPLRLSLLCETWNGSSLPDTQAQLYENYLQKVYTWNRNPDIRNDQATRCRTNITKLKKRLNKQLGKLAKAALDLPQERFRLSQRLVEQYLGEEIDNQSPCYLALRLGWLNRVGVDSQGHAIFAFYHATFQEYFAALSVDDWDYFLPRNHVNFPVQGKEYRIFEPQWKQVILLWLGRGDVLDEEKGGFIDKLVNFDDGCGEWNFEQVDRGFYEYRAYFLAAAGITEFKKCSLADEIITQMAKFDKDNEINGDYETESINQTETFGKFIISKFLQAIKDEEDMILGMSIIDLLRQFLETTHTKRTDIIFSIVANNTIKNYGIFLNDDNIEFRPYLNNIAIIFGGYSFQKISGAYMTEKGDILIENHYCISVLVNEYNLLRECTKKLPYPNFYHLWHKVNNLNFL